VLDLLNKAVCTSAIQLQATATNCCCLYQYFLLAL